MPYGLLNDNVIYNSKQCNVVEQAFVYEKAYPSEALKPIVFHVIDDHNNIEDHIKTIVHDYGTQGISDDQLFTINVNELTVGNYFFGGLVFDSMSKSTEFIKDLKIGHIQLAIIGVENCLGNAGLLVLDLLHLCKDVQTPVIHIFIPQVLDKDVLKKINKGLGENYFIKYGNEVFND